MLNTHFPARGCALLLALCLVFCLAGCKGSGPESSLEETAKALKAKDSGAFLAQVDMDAFASHELANLRQDNALLDFAGKLGSMLDLQTDLGALLNSVMNLKQQYTKTFVRTVGSGELVNQCTKAQTPDCPWDPRALEQAEVKKLDEETAVARVTTTANMTSWIALRKKGDRWLIVGKAVLEETAVRYARDVQPLPSPQPDRTPVMPGTKPRGGEPKAERL